VRWSYRGLDQAERVELMTQQTLLVMLWLMPLSFALPALSELHGDRAW